MDEMTKEQINRELCGLLDIPWHERIWDDTVLGYHCSCEKPYLSYSHPPNPDFYSEKGIIDLLRIMMEREGRGEFLHYLWTMADQYYWPPSALASLIDNYLTDTDGKFAIAVLGWLKGEGE